jgi:hypothetical protein
MTVILDERQYWLSKAAFLHPVEPNPQKNRLIIPTVLKLNDGNQIQDDCHGGYIGCASALVTESRLTRIQYSSLHEEIRLITPTVRSGASRSFPHSFSSCLDFGP